MSHGRVPLILVIAAVLVPGLASAQSDGFAFTGINFNYTNPGARARGIGGAFVALADDSTAALANPAGIAYLEREFTFEGIRDEEEFPVGQLTQGGVEVDFSTTGLSLIPAGDPFRVRTGSSEDRLNYASAVVPIRANRLTVAAYYAVLGDLTSSFQVGDGVMCVDSAGNPRLPGAGDVCTTDFTSADPEQGTLAFGQHVSYSLRTRLYGAAIGYRVNDYWSIGGSLAAATTSLEARADIDRSALGGDNSSQASSVDDDDLMFSAGVLYRADRWGFGLSYRSEGRFAIANQTVLDDGSTLPSATFDGDFTVPERLAAGVFVMPTDAWIVAAEITRVPYSDVLSRMRPFNSDAADLGVRYRISDVTEYHLGVEYSRWEGRRGWSLRGGWWRDTTHLPWVDETYADASQPEDGFRAIESLVRTQTDEDIDHLTAGVGFSFGRSFRIDAAVDWTDASGTDALVSAVVYF
jgi:hypothetical protein